MARSSKPETVAEEAGAKPTPRARRTARSTRRVPEAVYETVTVEPDVSAHVELPDVESPAIAAASTEIPVTARSMPEPPEDKPAEPVLLVEPAIAETVPALQALPGRLHSISLRFWQGQLERAMATGQAITVCWSPVAAIRLQMAYVQATLASGIEHASQVARLSQDIARDMLPSHPR